MNVHFLILATIILINGFFQKIFTKRAHILLIISILVMFVYLAIRYDYGTDYMNYYKLYTTKHYLAEETTEFLFWKLFYWFDNYTNFIVFHTSLICLSVYFFVKKYIPYNYYTFFFLLFFIHPGMIYCMITALRSAMVACCFIFIATYSYIYKKNIIFYSIGIIIASFFHTSVLPLLILPLWDYFMRHVNRYVLCVIFIIALIASITLYTSFSSLIVDKVSAFSRYSYYLEQEKFLSTSSGVIILRSFYLFPLYFLIKDYYTEELEQSERRIYILTFLFFLVFFCGLDFQNRYTVILYPFVIASFVYTLRRLKSKIFKISFYASVFFIVGYTNYIMYQIYYSDLNIQGNFLFYQTIYSLTVIP